MIRDLTFFLVCVVLSTSCIIPSDCGIDGKCWNCVSGICVPNPGQSCIDWRGRTKNDVCQSNGECIGPATLCKECSDDNNCGNTMDLIRDFYSGAFSEPNPWQSIACLIPRCRKEIGTDRKCCMLAANIGAPCNDGNAATPGDVCRVDGICHGEPYSEQPCVGIRTCEHDLECVGYVSIPPTAECLEPRCIDHACSVGPVVDTHKTCGFGGTCDVSTGECIECQDGDDTCAARGYPGDCKKHICVSNVCTIQNADDYVGGCNGGNGDCVSGVCIPNQCHQTSDCTQTTLDCAETICDTNKCVTNIKQDGLVCSNSRSKVCLDGVCVGCITGYDCQHKMCKSAACDNNKCVYTDLSSDIMCTEHQLSGQSYQCLTLYDMCGAGVSGCGPEHPCIFTPYSPCIISSCNDMTMCVLTTLPYGTVVTGGVCDKHGNVIQP